MKLESDDLEDERFVPVSRSAWVGGQPEPETLDLVAREEPLELRVGGVPIAVVMRTPGHDEELARGFLLSERILEHPGQIASIRHCDTVSAPEAEDNVMLVRLREDCTIDLAALRRNLYASSSCGVCGKASIDAAMAPTRGRLPRPDPIQVELSTLYALPEALSTGQQVFARTGGLHAAGLFSSTGQKLVIREDVGRHNTVDKVIGWAAMRGVDLADKVLMVSGRVSFEITQKAAALGIPVVAAVSAPSSLAIGLAQRTGLTLVCFVRGQRLCVYSGAERLVPATHALSSS